LTEQELFDRVKAAVRATYKNPLYLANSAVIKIAHSVTDELKGEVCDSTDGRD
jgi:hypothetical protein